MRAWITTVIFGVILCQPAFGQDVPFKPEEEFQIQLDFTLRTRPVANPNSIEFDRPRRLPTPPGQLPYLVIRIKLITVRDTETRVRVQNDNMKVMYSRKIEQGAIVPVDLGFVADIKDGISPRIYNLYLLNRKGDYQGRIEMRFDDRGGFFVNGEKHGAI